MDDSSLSAVSCLSLPQPVDAFGIMDEVRDGLGPFCNACSRSFRAYSQLKITRNRRGNRAELKAWCMQTADLLQHPHDPLAALLAGLPHIQMIQQKLISLLPGSAKDQDLYKMCSVVDFMVRCVSVSEPMSPLDTARDLLCDRSIVHFIIKHCPEALSLLHSAVIRCLRAEVPNRSQVLQTLVCLIDVVDTSTVAFKQMQEAALPLLNPEELQLLLTMKIQNARVVEMVKLRLQQVPSNGAGECKQEAERHEASGASESTTALVGKLPCTDGEMAIWLHRQEFGELLVKHFAHLPPRALARLYAKSLNELGVEYGVNCFLLHAALHDDSESKWAFEMLQRIMSVLAPEIAVLPSGLTAAAAKHLSLLLANSKVVALDDLRKVEQLASVGLIRAFYPYEAGLIGIVIAGATEQMAYALLDAHQAEIRAGVTGTAARLCSPEFESEALPSKKGN